MQRSPQPADPDTGGSSPDEGGGARPSGRGGAGGAPSFGGSRDSGGRSSRGRGDDGRSAGRGRGDDATGRRQLMRYAGLSTQVAASVGVALWLGIKADKWLKLSFPIFSWALPLLVIVLLLVQLIKASSGGKNEK